MKKLSILFLLFLSAGVVHAESMRFVTLLSQPVASFSKVEVLNPDRPTHIYQLNFCNENIDGGTITVGTTPSTSTLVSIDTLQADHLISNVKNFYTQNIYLGPHGKLTASSFVGNMKVDTNTKIKVAKDLNFYEDNTIYSKVAAFDNLLISGVAKYTKLSIEDNKSGPLTPKNSEGFGWENIPADGVKANDYTLVARDPACDLENNTWNGTSCSQRTGIWCPTTTTKSFACTCKKVSGSCQTSDLSSSLEVSLIASGDSCNSIGDTTYVQTNSCSCYPAENCHTIGGAYTCIEGMCTLDSDNKSNVYTMYECMDPPLGICPYLAVEALPSVGTLL